MSASTDRNSHCFSRWVIGAWLAAAGVMAPPGHQARAADFPVHDTGDPVANGAALVGAINAAMHTAEEDDRVLLDPGVRYVLTNADASTPNTGLPVINSGISIQGGFNSKGDITTIERQAGSAPFRILLIQPRIEWVKMPGCSGPTPVDIKPTVRLEYLKITNGDASAAGPVDSMGGAIQNEDGQLFLLRSELSGNTASLGGGIDNYPYVLIFTNYCSATPVKEGKNFLGDVTIQESRVHGNSASDSGGGINNSGGLMRIDHSTIDANQTGDYGGGIYNIATLEIANSTISGNFPVRAGPARPANAVAGIENAGGRLTVSFSTVTLNKGSGIANDIFLTGVVTMHDTIVAGNVGVYDDSPDLLPFDCFGAIRSLGHNLIGVIQPHGDPSNGCNVTTARGDQIGSDRTAPLDAKLGPLAANGAFTPTHALLDGSPAINHADSTSAVCPVDDQRGIVRRRIPGDACDVGAFEKVEPGCGLDCNLWRIVSVCARNPFVCEKLLVPKIENLPPVPDCLLDGPGCLIPPPVDFQ